MKMNLTQGRKRVTGKLPGKIGIVVLGTLFILMGIFNTAWAAVRSSDNYRMPSEVLSGGGNISTSSFYINQSSVGQVGVVGNVSSSTSGQRNQQGFWPIVAAELAAAIGNDILLTIGWNLISLPRQPSGTAIEPVLNSIASQYESVWAFQNGNWKVYDPASPEFSDLTSMEAGWGYWIKMIEAATLSLSGSTPSKSIPLIDGWNLVGYNATNSQDIANALASIEGKYISVWAFIDGAWKVYDPANPDFSDLLTMEPDYGYWINTTQACTWVLP